MAPAPPTTIAAATSAEQAGSSTCEAASPQLTALLQGHIDAVQSVCCVPGHPGLLLSGSSDQTMRIWRLVPGMGIAAPAGLRDATAAVAAASAAGSVAAGAVGAAAGVFEPSAAADCVCAPLSAGMSGAVLPEQHSQPATESKEPAAGSSAYATACPAAGTSMAISPPEPPRADAASASPSEAAPSAPGVASAPAGGSGGGSKRWRRGLCAGATKSALPELPGLTSPEEQQEAVAACIALAHMLYAPGTQQPPQLQGQQPQQREQQHEQARGDLTGAAPASPSSCQAALLGQMAASLEHICGDEDIMAQLGQERRATLHMLRGDPGAMLRAAAAADGVGTDIAAFAAAGSLPAAQLAGRMCAARRDMVSNVHVAAMHMCGAGAAAGAAAAYKKSALLAEASLLEGGTLHGC